MRAEHYSLIGVGIGTLVFIIVDFLRQKLDGGLEVPILGGIVPQIGTVLFADERVGIEFVCSLVETNALF